MLEAWRIYFLVCIVLSTILILIPLLLDANSHHFNHLHMNFTTSIPFKMPSNITNYTMVNDIVVNLPPANRSKHAWNTYAPCFTTLADVSSLYNDLVIPSVIRAVEESRDLGKISLVDLGCGAGNLLSHLLAMKKEMNLVGIDFSEWMLDMAVNRTAAGMGKKKEAKFGSKSGTVKLMQLDLESYEAVGATINSGKMERFADVVTCVMTLQELDDIQPLAQLVDKIAKEDATFVVVVPHPCFNQPAAHRQYSADLNGASIKALKKLSVTGYISGTVPPIDSHTGALPSGCDNSTAPGLFYYHRTISEIINTFSRLGDWQLAGIEEPTFVESLAKKMDESGMVTVPMGSWEAWTTFPPVMTLRFDRFEDIFDFPSDVAKENGKFRQTEILAGHKH